MQIQQVPALASCKQGQQVVAWRPSNSPPVASWCCAQR